MAVCIYVVRLPHRAPLQCPLTQAGFFQLLHLVNLGEADSGQCMLETFGYQRAVEMLLWFNKLHIELHEAWRFERPDAGLDVYRHTEKIAMWVAVQDSLLYQECLQSPLQLEHLEATYAADDLFYVPPAGTDFLRIIDQLFPRPS